MKVVRKGKCECGPTKVRVSDIRKGIVFSGAVMCETGASFNGTWMKTGFDNRVVNLETGDTMSHNLNVVYDYKELNAYLCIEE